MNYTEIKREARRLSKSSTQSYPDIDLNESINRALERAVSIIRTTQGRWQWDDTNYDTLPFATANVTSGTGDYSLDPTHYRIDKVEIMDANGAWRTLIPFDISDPRCQSYSNMINAEGQPLIYDKVGNSLILSPKPNYTRSAGIKVSYERGPSYFEVEDTIKTPGINPLYHRLIPLWAAYDYAFINNTVVSQSLEKEIAKIEAAMADYYGKRDKTENVRLGVRRQGSFYSSNSRSSWPR